MKKIKKHYILLVVAIFFTGVVHAGTGDYIKSLVSKPGLLIRGRSQKLYFVSADEASWSTFFTKKLKDQELSQKIETTCLDLSDDEMRLLTGLLAVAARSCFQEQENVDNVTKYFLAWIKRGWRVRKFFCEEIVSISCGSKVRRYINRKNDCFLFHWRRLVFIADELGIPLLTQLCASHFVLSSNDFSRQINKYYESPEFFWHGLGDGVRLLIKKYSKFHLEKKLTEIDSFLDTL